MPHRIEDTLARSIKQVPGRNSPLSWALLEVRDLKGLIQVAGAALAHSREVENQDCNCQVCWVLHELETGIQRGKPVQNLGPFQEAKDTQGGQPSLGWRLSQS